MKTRLDLLSSNLVKKITISDKITQRKIAFAVSEFVISRVGVKNSVVDQFNKIIRESKQDDQDEFRDEILVLVNRLDEIQWAIKNQVDLGKETMQKYLEAFSNARTINSLYYALDPDPFVAATETTYEAYAATEDLKSLESIIYNLLK